MESTVTSTGIQGKPPTADRSAVAWLIDGLIAILLALGAISAAISVATILPDHPSSLLSRLGAGFGIVLQSNATLGLAAAIARHSLVTHGAVTAVTEFLGVFALTSLISVLMAPWPVLFVTWSLVGVSAGFWFLWSARRPHPRIAT